MKHLISLTAAAMLAAGTLQADPYCPQFPDPAAMPKKYQRLAPVLSDTDTGWIFTQDMLNDDYLLNATEAKLMQSIADEFAARGVTFAVLMAAPRPIVAGQAVFSATAGALDTYAMDTAAESFEALTRQVQGMGVVMPNLIPVAGEGYYFQRDTHWTPTGAALSVRALADALKAADPVTFAGVIGADFTPEPTGEMLEEKGSLAGMGRDVCDLDVAREQVPLVTLPERATGLLDDTTGKLRVALAGSSFSDRYQKDAYRVADSLATFLDAEVENFSVSGGGSIGALEGMITSGLLSANAYDLVVWEVPYTEGLKLSALRQVLGALTADSLTTAAAAEVPVSGKALTIASADLPASPRLLSLRGVHAETEKVSVKLTFADDKAKTYKLVRKSRVPAELRSGDWSVSLDHVPSGDLQSIEITADKASDSMVARFW